MISDARRTQIKWTLYLAALLMFISSLFVPAFSAYQTSIHPPYDRPTEEWAGWWLLLLGPLGILIGQFGWFANPLMLASAMPIPRYLAIVFAGLATALAVSTVTLTSIPVADVKYVVRGAKLGFALWLGCPFLLLLAALVKPDGQKSAAPRKG